VWLGLTFIPDEYIDSSIRSRLSADEAGRPFHGATGGTCVTGALARSPTDRCPSPAATLACRQPQAHQFRLRGKRPPGPLGPAQRAALRRTQVWFRGRNQDLSPADQSDRAARQRRPVTIDRRYLGRRGSADLVRAKAARRGPHCPGGRTRRHAGARRRAPGDQAEHQPAYDAQHRSADNPGGGLHPASPPLTLPASGEHAAGAGPLHGPAYPPDLVGQRLAGDDAAVSH
jgi:hypothetical protein